MEIKKNISILFINLWLTMSTIAIPAPQKSQNSGTGAKAEMIKFHAIANIQLRYAITNIETQVRNRHSETKEVFFDMFIPKEAFVSNFSMVIKGKTYEAKVETKEIAQKIYNESASTSGLVQSNSLPEFTDGKQVSNIFFLKLAL